MKLSGAKILIESLKKEGVKVIFGYPGGVVLPIFDVLYDAPLKFILTRHEQGAAHAADGYARATGRAGVCLATSGPGAANLVTGIATAYMDSIPIVAVTGQVKTHLIGSDAFQEADVTGITRPITKHNYLVKDVAELAQTIKNAFYLAQSGRPGPVLIDLPVDVALAETEFHYPKEADLRGYKPTLSGHPGQIKKAAKAISQSKRPIIYAGGGVIISGASAELKKLVEKTSIPVTTTLLGLGCFPETHKLSLGMLGMHGTVYANHTIMESDLIIAVGARFDDRVTGKLEAFAPNAKIIHIDIDPSAISKNVKVDIPIVGDARNILSQLNKIVQAPQIKKWLERVDNWKKKSPLTYKKDEKLRPQYVVEQIYELTKGQAIVCTEVGQNQMWAAQFYQYTKPRTYISSGGLGTMGYGFPAAIGAQVGRPKDTVFDIAGDGSFQMNIQELATAVANKLPVKIAILDNCYLGMVRQWQELFYKKRYSYTYLANPDFVKVAQAYGAQGIRVEKKKDVRKAIQKALSIKDSPVVLDFIVEKEENVFPMVPAGEAINRMIGGMA
ncbi:MAG: biosynthetic-type acetolactate synthase large subunit [Candidatus Omnitrophica bacterium]|nr:biosynthetic-type acetolactate synthase large subunit [Candidatus Omnitrophota bacterium]MBU3933875.1 biosynthetic-type acetolactate synthase large subunit [Candidatus Omnitrophota bacterium]